MFACDYPIPATRRLASSEFYFFKQSAEVHSKDICRLLYFLFISVAVYEVFSLSGTDVQCKFLRLV